MCELKLELQSGNDQIWTKFVLTSATLTFNFWPWPSVWTSLLSMAITPENFMMMRWQEHFEKGVTDGRTDRSILRADWSQLQYLRLATILARIQMCYIWIISCGHKTKRPQKWGKNALSFQSPEYTSSLFKMLYDGGSVLTILTKYRMQEARLQNSLLRWGTEGLSPGYSERGWGQSQNGWKVPWSTSVGWGCSYHNLWTQEHPLSSERKSNMKFKRSVTPDWIWCYCHHR